MMRACMFVVACAGACAPAERLVFSYEGSEAGFVQASEAAAQWRDVCGADVTVQREGGGVPLLEVERIGVAPSGHPATGATTMRGDEVRRILFVRSDGAGATLTHEFGHALGIEAHAASGIMATGSERRGDERVTPADCAALTGSEGDP